MLKEPQTLIENNLLRYIRALVTRKSHGMKILEVRSRPLASAQCASHSVSLSSFYLFMGQPNGEGNLWMTKWHQLSTRGHKILHDIKWLITLCLHVLAIWPSSTRGRSHSDTTRPYVRSHQLKSWYHFSIKRRRPGSESFLLNEPKLPARSSKRRFV